MRRSLVAFALAASFSTSFPNPTTLFDPLCAWFSSFWGDSAAAKEGIGLDPNGVTSPIQPPYVEEGCGWDPNGANSCEPPKI